VPNDLLAYHFTYIIRKRIKLPESDGLFFFVNGNHMLKNGKKFELSNYLDTLMADVYEKKKDSDGFLYIVYTDESTLGGDWIRLEDYLAQN
jgi:GABA(A) receptor-associated protein